VAFHPGGLLVTCSGTDAIIVVGSESRELWQWFAMDHGYGEKNSRLSRDIRRAGDLRRAKIQTQHQATHINSAFWDASTAKPRVLATLFHQGEVVTIDVETGHCEVVLKGLAQPHSIRRYGDDCWILSDSRHGAVVITDANFWVTATCAGSFSWVQDAIQVGPNEVLVADANHSRCVRWDVQRDTTETLLTYSPDWKVYQIEALTDSVGSRLAESGEWG
jgi:hypothetical protein